MNDPNQAPGARAFRSLAELPELAARQLAAPVWDYVQGGAGDERTLAANLAAFRRRAIVPRLLRGLRHVDLRSRVLGSSTRAPFFASPTAYQGSVHPDAELATARGCARAGVVGAFSTLSTASLEGIASATPTGPRWFQLYLQQETEASLELVARAERAGFAAVVLTADVPVLGVRDRQLRHGFALDQPPPLGNGRRVSTPARALELRDGVYHLPAEAQVDWTVLDALRAHCSLPLLVKGVLRGEDAVAALEHGASGVIVSNHGGRQLDAAPASLDALAGVVTAVNGRGEVFLDGGIRRGVDALIALALGARAVGVGRPVLWALACGGEDGVVHLWELLEQELASALALAGYGAPSELTPEAVVSSGDRPVSR